MGHTEHNFKIEIPAYIAKSENLTGNEKLVCGAVFGLCSNLGKCIARNEYIGSLLGLTINSIEKIISNLYSKKVIKNIGTKRYRELILSKHFENITENLNRRNDGSNRRNDGSNRRNGESEPSKWRLLPIIYNNIYIYGQIRDIDPSFDPEKVSDTKLKNMFFEYFWENYPNKVKKKPTKEIFLKLKDEQIEQLLKVVPQIKSYYTQKDDEISFVPAPPHPNTFLNQERWTDEQYLTSKKSQEGGDIKKGSETLSPLDVLVQKIGEIGNGEDVCTLEQCDREMLDRVGLSIEQAVEVIDYEQRKGLKQLIMERLDAEMGVA